MILLSLLVISLIFAISATAVKLIFKPKWKFLTDAAIILIALSVIFGVLCTCFASVLNSKQERLESECAQLTLYADTIQESNNEYVRFDFYSRVIEYNNAYTQFEKDMNSKIIGALGPENWNENIAFVYFPLRTGG